MLKIGCPENCKCKTGGSGDGGKAVNDQGYCIYHCSDKRYCGDGSAYLTGTDCRGCGGKQLLLRYQLFCHKYFKL